jgi:hypothetical protein
MLQHDGAFFKFSKFGQFRSIILGVRIFLLFFLLDLSNSPKAACQCFESLAAVVHEEEVPRTT